jgi:hypothetical protein
MASLTEITDILKQIWQKVEELPERIRIAGNQIQVTKLSEISSILGLIMAGEFRAGNGKEPGRGFTGGRFGWPQFWYDGKQWFLVGVNNDDMQFGVNAETGELEAGNRAVRLGGYGINMYGNTAGNPVFQMLQTIGAVDHNIGTLRGYYDGINSAWTDLIARRQPGNPWTVAWSRIAAKDYVQANDLRATELYVSSDDYITQKSHHNYMATFHPNAATSPVATVVAGGSIPVGTTRYAITYYDTQGETSIGAVTTDVVITTGNQTVNLTAVPLGKPHITGRKIYRRVNGNNRDYRLLTTLADNTTTTFSDNLADGSLGVHIPIANTTGGNYVSGPILLSNGGVGAVRSNPTILAYTPRAPIASLVTTSGNVDAGTHSYAICFLDSIGNSTARSEISNVITADSTHGQVDLILPRGPGGTYGRYLYRTKAGNQGEWYEVAWLGNTEETYRDNIADASLSPTHIPPSSTTLYRPVFPRSLTFFFDVAEGPAMTSLVSSFQQFNVAWESNVGKDGDEFRFGGMCDAGTYTGNTLGVKGMYRGSTDLYVDGAKVGTTFDWYDGSSVYNTIHSVPNIVIPEPGYHYFTVKVNGKNGASGGYKLAGTKLSVVRSSY